MPTLLEKGKIILQPWHKSADKKMINETRAIDFLMEWVSDRIWESPDIPPKMKLRGAGSKVLVLRSGTGSGKSTVIPPALYNKFIESKILHGNILITQPKILTAQDIPYQITKYNDNIKMGEQIGYQTGVMSRKPVKGILFSTVGILLQFLKTYTPEQFMSKYKFIIIDEVHERSIDVDQVLFYLKKMLSEYYAEYACPMVILMSATIDAKVFMDYFECPTDHFIDVEGLSFPIEDNFSDFAVSNLIDYIVDKIEYIHVNNLEDLDKPIRDIMVFVQGTKQIKEIIERLHKLNANVLDHGMQYAKKHSADQQKKYGGNEEKYYLAPIALMSENIKKGDIEYMNLFSPIESVEVNIYETVNDTDDYIDKSNDTKDKSNDTNDKPNDSKDKPNDTKDKPKDVKDTTPLKIKKIVPASRRVIIATNSAETGLTIDTLKYCIDSGYVKDISYDPNFSCSVMIDKPVTQASSRQRRGRVGRLANGIFHACYTLDTYKHMQLSQHPEIVRESITSFLLTVLLQETKTSIEEVSFDKKTVNCFQMNQFTQQWYKINTETPFNAALLDFIQYPSSDSMSDALSRLHGLGFIDHEYKPTIFGIYANKFRKLRLENIRMILAGYHEKANILDLITIACMLQLSFELGIKKNKYVNRNPLGLSEQEANYYYKLVFADEFIEYLFIWDEFMNNIGKTGDQMDKKLNKTITRKTKILPMNYIINYCKDNGFNLSGLLKVIELRDEVINDMLVMGLNPYYNGLDLPRGSYNLVDILKRNLSDGLDEIKKIKKCIYEGYRFSLYITNESGRYINYENHIPISLDSRIVKPLALDEDIEQIKPQKIIVATVLLQKNSITGVYEFIGNDVSVMDGYVDVDVQFLSH